MERNSQEKRDLEVSDILLFDTISTAASQATIHEQDNALSELTVKTLLMSLANFQHSERRIFVFALPHPASWKLFR